MLEIVSLKIISVLEVRPYKDLYVKIDVLKHKSQTGIKPLREVVLAGESV